MMFWMTTIMTLPSFFGVGSPLRQGVYRLVTHLKQGQQWLCRWHCSHTRCATAGVAHCPDCGQSVVRLWVLPVHDPLTDTRRWEWVAEPNYFNTQRAVMMTLPVHTVALQPRRGG
jgi:hypothetical protein